MKKRLIGLLLALCLIVGLLPVAALAEEVPASAVKKVAFTTKDGIVKEEEVVVENNVKEWTADFSEPVYGKTSADGLTIDWEKATATDYNIAIRQSATGLEVELKDAYMKLTAEILFAIQIEYDGALTVKLVGKNVIENVANNSPACLYLRAKSTVITGGGSLTANSIGFQRSNPVYKYGSTLDCDNDLTIKDVTLNLKQTGQGNPYTMHTIRCSGNVVIDHAVVDLYAQFANGIILSTDRTTATINKTAETITIKNGAKVTVDAKTYAFRPGDNGAVIIDTTGGTDVICKTQAGPFKFTPVIQGNVDSDIVYSAKADGTDAKPYTYAEKTKLTAYTEMLYFSLTHKHTGGTATCAKKAVCTICNEEYGETAAHTYTRTDCSKDSVCSVCNQVVVKAGAHEGGTATCKEKAVCTICKQAYGELGAHTGGTATCVAKAKCDVCKAEYGELGAHAPEADDKDCTTEQKCTLCKTVLVAAKEHKFVNDKDKSCENSGCAYVRGNDTPTTNPNTGDISILLTAAVALTSAVGFAGVTVLRKKEN